MGVTFTWLCGLCQQFLTRAIGWAFLHVRFHVRFHLGEAITSPFAAWYLSEMSNPKALERDNAFLFLKIALHLQMDFFPRKVSRLKSTLQNVGPASSERLYETISLSLLGKDPPQTSDLISQNMFVEQEFLSG